MRFKFSIALLPICILSACGGGDLNSHAPAGDNLIGKPVGAVSEMSDPNSVDRSDIVLFDKTVRLIHQFDLNRMSVVRTLSVNHTESIHSVLFDEPSGLIADFAEGHLTLFDRDSTRSVDPVNMTGQVKSAAYDPVHGYLVVYDDMNTVGIIHLNSDASIVQTWTGGPILQHDVSLTAGDLIGDGSLVLALQDGSIAKVDVVQTLSQNHWVFTSVSTTLGRIKWLAPVRGYNDRVLVLNDTSISVVSLVDGSLLASRAIAHSEHVIFESKTRDPHVILKDGAALSVVYTDGISIHSPSLSLPTDLILKSRLCLTEDSWSFVTSKPDISYSYNEHEDELTGRTFRKYRLSDFRADQKMDLPDQAQFDVSEKYIFALYPSELGYGLRLGIADKSKTEIKMFNAGHIH